MEFLNKFAGVLAAIAIVFSVINWTLPDTKIVEKKLSGTTNFDALTLDRGNLTLSNGSVTIAIPSTGTSTLATIGCIGGYATSSATAIKFIFNTSGTSTLSGTANGVVAWKYGVCP